MIIDFHTHIFPDKIANSTISVLQSNSNHTAYTNGTVDGLIKAMEASSADISIALPVLTKPTQFDSITKFALEVNKRFENEKRRIISFGGMHPKCEDIDGKMKYLKELGFIGVKIHPDYQNTFVDDEGYIEILNSAKKYDLVVVTHAGVDEGFKGEPVKCTPDRVLNLIEKTKHKKFVLAHFGGNLLWEEVFEKLAGKEVYFDTAFTLNVIDFKLFKKILDKHGDDKVLFATDSPWQDILTNVNILKSYELSKETEDKILYKNALKLLNLMEN